MNEETKKKLSERNKKLGIKPPSRLGIPNTEEQKKKISDKLKGKKRSIEICRKISLSKIGKHTPHSIEARKRKSERQKGANSHFWKGGKTKQSQIVRTSLEYKLWRKAVFERDNYTCIWGGKEHGNNLNADHIKPFSLFPELRFAIDNGRTLCEDCHRKTDTYGSRMLPWRKRKKMV